MEEKTPSRSGTSAEGLKIRNKNKKNERQP
jgi:hypothetical protein